MSDPDARIKSLGLTPALHAYLVEHGTPPDEIQQGLIEATRPLGRIARMQIAPEQGAFMTILARLIGARRAIELGTFTGYSALCIARGLPEDGELVACDVSEEWAAIGRPFWQRAGVAEKIDLRIAPALETLTELGPDGSFDFAFVDAVKTEYAAYLEELHRLVRPGGVILVDNVLWGGSVVDPEKTDESTQAIRAFNEGVASDERFDRVMLPLSDGLSLLRVR
ncbi:MAG: class I SAM-dependent methyltransferase [Deltaproteobacteria bacterium]|jgi:caffeoyl-CoA O-methyltransferase|nr:class I SAM-dependent methyltransferase [Deltaproteobacteria bacterium]MBW2500933.1 class I SAM-dependent methyltransferase [Deltaproteobacteria bacterium]